MTSASASTPLLFEAHFLLKYAMSSGVVGESCKSETQEKTSGILSKIFGKTGDNFPYIDTFKCDYSLEEVSKLSSLNSYNLVEGLKNAALISRKLGSEDGKSALETNVIRLTQHT